jgi:hypothetical protein
MTRYMAYLPGQVASADGLRPEDRALVRRLVQQWATHVGRNTLRHVYYTMHNRLKDLGISVPPELKNLNAACGWGKKCVDVMVEHSKLDGFTVGDRDDQNALDAVWRRNHLRTKYRRAATSALEQCFSLWFVSRDDGGHARVSCYPASACGCSWDDARDELEAALFVVSASREPGQEGEPDWVNLATATDLVRIRRIGGVWRASYEPHGLGHVPAFVTAYEPTLHRPFGTSRITREVMGYIDSAVRANVNEEIAAAFAASTQKYLLGTDGDPFEKKTQWQSFIGSIFNIDKDGDGDVPAFGQLPQPSMQPLADHWRLLCGRMSAATGIHVSQFGQVHDNPASSDAIYAENEPLILKVRDWNDDAGDVLAEVAVACLATERGTTFDEALESSPGIEAHFRNPAMPTLAQQTDASVKLASVVEGFSETDTFWEMNGFAKEERDRVRRELRWVRGQNVLDDLLREGIGNEGEPGGDPAVREDAG